MLYAGFCRSLQLHACVAQPVPASLYAQSSVRHTIHGTVTDSCGAFILKAEVQVANLGTHNI